MEIRLEQALNGRQWEILNKGRVIRVYDSLEQAQKDYDILMKLREDLKYNEVRD